MLSREASRHAVWENYPPRLHWWRHAFRAPGDAADDRRVAELRRRVKSADNALYRAGPAYKNGQALS